MRSSCPTTSIRCRRWRGLSNRSSANRWPVRVNELLEVRASEMPRKTALVCGNERYTYAELDEHARRFARLIHAAGIRPLDRVAICLDNSVDAIVSLFGVLKAGGIFFVVNPHARADYRNQLIRDSGASAVVERDASGRPD